MVAENILQHIFSIPMSAASYVEDKLTWNHSEKGELTVKSAYEWSTNPGCNKVDGIGLVYGN